MSVVLFVVLMGFAPPDSVAPVRVGYHVAETDSSLRWSQWLNASERDSRREGRFTARLTGYLRHDASFINGHGPGRQRVYVDGVDVRDPVTGLVNPNRIPHLQLSRWEERIVGADYSAHLTDRHYKVNKPLTWINYEQGPYNLLSTEVLLAANTNPQTGFSARYWGRNDDGEYLNSETSGRTISLSGYHQLSSRWKAQGSILYNGLQTTEPGGYRIIDYIPNATSPLVFADASVRQTIARVSATDQQHWDVGVYHHRFRRFYNSTTDTSFYRVLGLGAYATRYLRLGPITADATLRAERYATDPQRRRSLDIRSWSRLEAEAALRYGWMSATAISAYRTDGSTDARLTALADMGLFYASASVGSWMPSIQQAHWRGYGSVPGSTESEYFTRVEGGFRWRDLSLSGYLRSTDTLNVAGGHAAYSHESDRWEYGASSTFQQNLNQAFFGTRVWNRAWFYWKGYLFDRATFVKTGFHATLVPIGYVAPTFDPLTDHWREFDPSGASIPSFYRVDWDLSARVRNLFILIRWEHLNQYAGQLGYEETAFYPMPGRGVRFGMRVVLRN